MAGILALLPVLALVGLGISAPNAARKCGGALPPNGKPLVWIDGVIAPPGTELSTLTKDDIYAFYVVCMDPKDSTFNRTRGVGVMSIWTKGGPAPRVAEALDVIRQAQDSSFARRGRARARKTTSLHLYLYLYL